MIIIAQGLLFSSTVASTFLKKCGLMTFAISFFSKQKNLDTSLSGAWFIDREKLAKETKEK
jgi:hypothetical protein